MLIAIDFDDTYTRDPMGWRGMVQLFRLRGHDFVMVTARSSEGESGREVRDMIGGLMPIVFAAGMWKKQSAKLNGYHVDVWIDDQPELVTKQYLLEVKRPEEKLDMKHSGSRPAPKLNGYPSSIYCICDHCGGEFDPTWRSGCPGKKHT
jgi:hypothetical protein